MTDAAHRPTHNSLVAKHNTLLPKLSKMGLSELRLLAYCLAHYDSRPAQEDGPPDPPQGILEFSATVQDLLGIFPYMDQKSAYEVVRKAVKGINSKPLEDTFITPEGEEFEMLIYWFSSFKYFKSQGKFVFSLSREIARLVLNLSDNFTKFKLRDVYQFRSALTWKLYELLKQWVPVGRWSASLDELRSSLGILGKYPEWFDFKRRVLDAPIGELNRLSDIVVEYEKQKRGRSVGGVVFFIQLKAENEARPKADFVVGDVNSDLKKLMGLGMNQSTAERLSRMAKEAGKDLSALLDEVLARYEQLPADKRAGPKAGYVYKALENEFTPSLFDYAAGRERPSREAEARPLGPPDDDPAWARIKGHLAGRVVKADFEAWIEMLNFRPEGPIAVFIAPNAFARKCIAKKFGDQLRAAAAAAGFADFRVEEG